MTLKNYDSTGVEWGGGSRVATGKFVCVLTGSRCRVAVFHAAALIGREGERTFPTPLFLASDRTKGYDVGV